MTDLNKLDSVFEKIEAPDIKLLREIGKRIGFGRACQILGEQWDDMLEKEWGLPRGRGKMERRNDIEAIEAAIAARTASQTCVAKPELLVKTWKERLPRDLLGGPSASQITKAMEAEIADLRAALSASEAKNAKAKAPMPITDAAYNNLRSIGRMVCNMLRRDETPVRAEAAEDLQHAIARFDPEMGETIIAPQPSQVAVSGILMPEELTDEMRAVLKEAAPKWNAESIYANLKDAARQPKPE